MYQTWKQMDRKFGYSKIKWKIDDYSMLSNCERWKILSPNFHVRGETVTAWQMVLEKHFHSDNIIFRLKLVNCVPNYSELRGTCELCISDEAAHLRTEFELSENTYENKIEIDSQCFRKDIVFDSSLTVELDFFVRSICNREDVALCADESLQKLSNDLLYMYHYNIGSDVNLLAGEENRCFSRAHKAILYCRNEKWRKMISLNEDSPYFCFDRLERCYDCHKILRFLYSANMRHVLYPPTKSVFDVASVYGISPITAYYAPDELTLHTDVVTGRFDATWLIPQNLVIDNENYFSSPKMFVSTEIECILHFYPFSVANNNYVGVKVVFVKGEDKAAFVEIFLETNPADDRVKMCRNKDHFPEIYPTTKKQVLRCDNFLHRSLLENYFYNGNLILVFRVRWISSYNFFTPPRTSLSVGTNIVRCRPYCEQANYYQLSEDMSKLYRSNKFRNFGFAFGSMRFQVNRSIFATRCYDFYNVVNNYSMSKFPIDYPEAMEKLIYFIYCGKNENSFTLWEYISLMTFADLYHFRELKNLLFYIFPDVIRQVENSLCRLLGIEKN